MPSKTFSFLSFLPFFGTPFSFRCSPCLVSAPISSSSFGEWIFLAQHFLCFFGLFFLSTLSSSQSHLNSSPKGVPAYFLSSIYFILYFSAKWNSSLLACPIPRHFSGFKLSLDTALLLGTSFTWRRRWPQVQDCPMPQVLDLSWKGIPSHSLVIHRTQSFWWLASYNILLGWVLFSPLPYFFQDSSSLLAQIPPYTGFLLSRKEVIWRNL